MARLLKLHEATGNKLPAYPTLTGKEDFRQKFFKLAKFLSKISTMEQENFVYLLSDFLPNLEDYDVISFNSVHIDDDLERSVSSIVRNRAKLTSDELSKVKVVFGNGDEIAYAILPNAPMATDGNTYIMRDDMPYKRVRFMSIGYVLLASILEKSVSEIAEGKVRTPFTISNESWKYFQRSSEAVYYQKTLDAIFKAGRGEVLNHRFAKESSKTIATFRDDKKYQDEDLNKNTRFNNMGFRKVEVDTQRYQGEDFDYKLFSAVEKDFESFYKRLPVGQAEPELKFRKLGRHNAAGLYCPFMNIVAVDVRHTESFIHEYGHYLDFKFKESVLSESIDFASIVDHYSNNIDNFAAQGAVSLDKINYFKTPTEIFARGFELWVHATIVSNSVLLKSNNIYNESPVYRSFEGCKEALFGFFNSVFSVESRMHAADLKSKGFEEPVGQLSLF